MKKEIEMKNDGKDGERFQVLLKTIVNVPKEDIKKEARQKKEKKKKDR